MPFVRCLAATAAVVLAARGVISGGTGPLTALMAGTATFDDLVAIAATAGALALLAWLGVALVVTALAALPGAVGGRWARLADRIAPGLAGRLVRLALGLSLAVAPVSACSPALADDGLPGVHRIGEVIEPTAEMTGPAVIVTEPAAETTETTEAATTAAVPTAEPKPTPTAGLVTGSTRQGSPTGEVVVRRGDTLWAIAARHLGPQATAAEIAEEWPRWYAANRKVIGSDPDLILPGTILLPPKAR